MWHDMIRPDLIANDSFWFIMEALPRLLRNLRRFRVSWPHLVETVTSSESNRVEWSSRIFLPTKKTSQNNVFESPCIFWWLPRGFMMSCFHLDFFNIFFYIFHCSYEERCSRSHYFLWEGFCARVPGRWNSAPSPTPVSTCLRGGKQSTMNYEIWWRNVKKWRNDEDMDRLG